MSERAAEITAESVDAAWIEASKLPVARIPFEMERAAREQPDLMALILASTEGMTAGVSELAGFIYFVLWRTFRAERGRAMEPVSASEIQGALQDNERVLQIMDGEDPRSLDASTLEGLTTQPALFRYVIDSIAEAEEEENDPVAMSPEEKGSVILLLKTAIDVLERAGGGTRGRSKGASSR